MIFRIRIRMFNSPRKEQPVISAKIPKIPPKLAKVSDVVYLGLMILISGFINLKWTMIRSSNIFRIFPLLKVSYPIRSSAIFNARSLN